MKNEELLNSLNEVNNTLASAISMIMRSLDTKEERLEALRRKKPTPPIEILKLVYKTAIEREDFETCEALKEFLNEKGVI